MNTTTKFYHILVFGVGLCAGFFQFSVVPLP